MKPTRVTHLFVEFVPEDLEAATLYISVAYATVVHGCLCGCGSRIVTPLSPTDWRMTYDGETISLFPSVGNWSFACQSHYWIDHNRVRWARRMSPEKIQAGRDRDRRSKQAYYSEDTAATEDPNASESSRPVGWLTRALRRD